MSPHSAVKKVDYIIVGLGLAGACLALHCWQRNRRVMVFDRPDENRASAVAAGLFNPITGRRMLKTWQADALFTYLARFYTRTELWLQRRFFYPTPLYIPFRSMAEQNDWLALRAARPAWDRYVAEVSLRPRHEDWVHNPFGGIEVARGGYVDTLAFLAAIREELQRRDSYREETLEERELGATLQAVSYRDVQASKIIFCTGAHIRSSPYFANLPIVPLKGETLRLRMLHRPDRIYSRGVYLLAHASGDTLLGSTYRHNDLAPCATLEGRDELVEKAKKLLLEPFAVTDQTWGVRPTTIDRKPILGRHPKFDAMFVFNGLGTKGVTLAPWFSRHMARLLDGTPLPIPDADIARLQWAC